MKWKWFLFIVERMFCFCKIGILNVEYSPYRRNRCVFITSIVLLVLKNWNEMCEISTCEWLPEQRKAKQQQKRVYWKQTINWLEEKESKLLICCSEAIKVPLKNQYLDYSVVLYSLLWEIIVRYAELENKKTGPIYYRKAPIRFLNGPNLWLVSTLGIFT